MIWLYRFHDKAGLLMSEGLKSRHVTFPRSWLGLQGLLGCEYSRGLGTSYWTLGMWAFCGPVGLLLRWSLLLQEPVSAVGPLSLLPSYPALPEPVRHGAGSRDFLSSYPVASSVALCLCCTGVMLGTLLWNSWSGDSRSRRL